MNQALEYHCVQFSEHMSQDTQIDTLLDLLPIMKELGHREAVRYNTGLRTFVWTYDRLYRSIAGCADAFSRQGLRPGQRIVLWGENRPEWIIVFWAALARGLQVVPIDEGFSPDFVRSIIRRTEASFMVVSENLQATDVDLPGLRFSDVARLPGAQNLHPAQARAEDTVEIVFTSGTTGEPKGIEHTHANICANLRSLSHEISSFQKYIRLLQPLRIVTILPLSHMFGQALGLFVPILLRSAVVLVRKRAPTRLIQAIKEEKAAALVTVPGHLDSLQSYIQARFDCDRRMRQDPGILGLVRRWLRFRDVHRMFGLKFAVLVVGGAQLRPAVEAWWSGLGFVIVQGYGLTEASPVVAMNNPLKPKSGSLGHVLEGQQVRIASDGEILVQGPNVARFFDSQSDSEGNEWLRTGDIGRIDEEGNLYYLGRKKDVIVTREGQNVYPEDVENVLRELPQVTDCAVVGKETQRGTVVHAVFIFKDSRTRPEDVVQKANSRLEAHQRIRSWSVWPQSDFPRTPSTGKIKRRDVAKVVSTQERPKTRGEQSSVRGILAGFASREMENLSGQERLEEDLGLSSLDRVELMSMIEQELGLSIDEQVMAQVRTVEELEKAAEQRVVQVEREQEPSPQEPEIPEPEPAGVVRKELQDEPRSTGLSVPAWKGYFPCRWLRAAFQATVLPVTTRIFLRLRINGLERLQDIQPPVIFAANHSSHMDTPALLTALPLFWRLRMAPAVRQDFFGPLVSPQQNSRLQRLSSRLQYILLVLFINIYPLPQRTAGVRQALRYTGRLVDAGNCPLIFPEGIRTPDGRMRDFQRGVGFMARELDVPIVPIRLHGLFELFSIHHRFPRPGRAEVSFGTPVYPSPDKDAATLTTEVQTRIQEM